MLKEFREFLEKFNVIPIAIGLVLALAFQPLVDAVANLVLSIVGAIFGAEVSFDQLTFDVNGAPIPYGTVLTALFSFIVIAWIVFMIVKSVAKAGMRTSLAQTPDQALLTEIRDLLKAQQG